MLMKIALKKSNYTKVKEGINTSNGQIGAVGASPNRFDRLKEINKPTLIIHGTEDSLIPFDHGMALADNISNAKMFAMDGVGHEIPDNLLYEIIPILSAHLNLN